MTKQQEKDNFDIFTLIYALIILNIALNSIFILDVIFAGGVSLR